MGNELSVRKPSSWLLVSLCAYHAVQYRRGNTTVPSALGVITGILNQPSFIRIFTANIVGIILFLWLLRHLRYVARLSLQDLKNDWGSLIIEAAKNVPFLRKKLESEIKKIEVGLEKDLKPKDRLMLVELPKEGWKDERIIDFMESHTAKEKKRWAEGLISGAVYSGDEDHINLLNKAASIYAVANPLHADLWPSVMQFEAQICAMTASMVNGGDKGVCGVVTSGGTESIVLATRAHKERGSSRGILHPEVIACVSAHAAIDKACEMLGIRLVKVPMNPKTMEIDIRAVKRHINSDTIMIYSSAPQFPHGIIDPIEKLSEIAYANNVGLHVDGCLGGFVLPFARKLGYDVPAFDFGLRGVTSMSLDTHKYGYSHKGTSVTLYRNKELRRCQFFTYPEWTGGLYATPTIAGSKAGSLYAACWASLVRMGEEGFLNATKSIMDTTQKIRKGIEQIPGLYVLGDPKAMVVAFSSKAFCIYTLSDRLAKRGWSLNPLQKPACVHICVTLRHAESADRFLKEVREEVEHCKNLKGDVGGTAPIYGMASSLPSGPVKDVLATYFDVVLKP